MLCTPGDPLWCAPPVAFPLGIAQHTYARAVCAASTPDTSADTDTQHTCWSCASLVRTPSFRAARSAASASLTSGRESCSAASSAAAATAAAAKPSMTALTAASKLVAAHRAEAVRVGSGFSHLLEWVASLLQMQENLRPKLQPDSVGWKP